MSKRKLAEKRVSLDPPTRVVRVSALNEGQKNVLRSLGDPDNVVTIVNGEPGTGKTFLAMSYGLQVLRRGSFRRIIVSRPNIEVGEPMGSLPGGYKDKLQPFLTPVFDILGEHISTSEIREMTETGLLDVVPLAYMRGRTWRDSYVVLDEAQNATVKQMQMFLTRLGSGCKVVITGDTSQSDLNGQSGLRDAILRLQGVPGLDIHTLDASCIVRHPMIAEITRRYAQPLPKD